MAALSMYTTCTFRPAEETGVEFQMPIPRFFIVAALEEAGRAGRIDAAAARPG
jgi:hypothetical protein